MNIDVSINFRYMVLACMAYFLLHFLFLARCPAPIRAQILEMKRKEYPVSSSDLIRKWLHDSLHIEILTVFLDLSDVAGITHDLERDVIQHSIVMNKKRWQYDGLNQDGLRYIRELCFAATEARGGRFYENFGNGSDWEWREEGSDLNLPYTLHTAPTLYTCIIHTYRPLFPEIGEFRDGTDVAIQFSEHGRNFLPPSADHRVEYFIVGLHGIVTNRTSGAILNIVAKHESCRRAGSRTMGWLLICVILSYSIVTFVEHCLALIPILLNGPL
jgi:hypothetical protein